MILTKLHSYLQSSKLRLPFTPKRKNASEWITEVNLCDLGLGNGFLTVILKQNHQWNNTDKISSK
jgi:hypothetical protein